MLLANLTVAERDVVGEMLRRAYSGAVHMTLRVLDDGQVAPFDQPYEGTPYPDFMGRLSSDWEWPTDA